MKVRPSERSWDPVYALASLPRPRSRPTIESVVLRARRFTRDSIVRAVSERLWKLWEDSSLLDSSHPEYEYAHEVAAHADAIAMISIRHAPVHARAICTPFDVMVLCHELHLCDSGSAAIDDAHTLGELAGWHARRSQRSSPQATSKSIGDLVNAANRDVRVASVVGSLIRGTHVGYDTPSLNQWVRVHLLFKQLVHCAAAASVACDIESRWREYAGTDHHRFVRAMMVIFGHVANATPRGFVQIDREHTGANVLEDVAISDLIAIAERFSLHLDVSRGGGNQELPSGPLAPEIRLLRRLPLLSYSCAPRIDALYLHVPSPRHLLHAVQWIALDGFLAHLAAKESNFVTTQVRTAFGDALTSYVRRAFGDREDVIDLDALGYDKKRRPDFLWVGDTWIVAIEVKTRVTPIETSRSWSYSDMLEAWSRADGAFAQIEASGRVPVAVQVGWETKRRAGVLVTFEGRASDVLNLGSAVRRQIAADNALDLLHLAELAELEHFVAVGGADEYAKAISDAAASVSVEEIGTAIVPWRDEPVPNQIREGWRTLLPELDLPWEHDERNGAD